MSTRDSHRRRLMQEREQEPAGVWGWVGAAVLVAAMMLSAYVSGG